jgi:hypothetical protein
MSSGANETKSGLNEGETGRERSDKLHEAGEHVDALPPSEKDPMHKEILLDADLMNDAIYGENTEHEMSLWQSAKSHPMACLWAFIMCFTIVSTPQTWSLLHLESDLSSTRSWNRLTCF